MQNIITLISSLGGGNVDSANTPLTIAGGVLTIDLSGYTTTAALNTLLGAYTTTAALNTLLGAYTTTAALNTPLGAYTTPTILNTLLGTYTRTVALNTLLATKQNNLTASSGVFLSGNALTGYGLRWNINSTPSIAIQDLHFNGFTVTEAFNIGTSRNQLDIVPNLSAYTPTSSMNTLFNAKQDTLTAGSNITISGSTISATGGATQAWVTVNFLNLLNPGTVGVTAGLSASMTANSLIISVDQNFDRQNLFVLEDANNVLRNITTDTAGKLKYGNVNLATEPYVTSQLATKQNTLTAGAGCFLSGSQVAGYDLQWNINSVSSTAIRALHFKSGLDVSQSINLSSGQAELVAEHPAAHANSMITGLQAEVDKVYQMKASLGISLGSSAAYQNHRIMCYEDTTSNHHYSYGMGIFVSGTNAGLGLWGSSGANVPNYGAGGQMDPVCRWCPCRFPSHYAPPFPNIGKSPAPPSRYPRVQHVGPLFFFCSRLLWIPIRPVP